MRHRSVAITVAFFAVLAALVFSGCATVRPWERGILAKPCMLVSPDPEESKTEQHLLAYREGSAGGYGDSGGGCGCN